jgi:hypothetical protein
MRSAISSGSFPAQLVLIHRRQLLRDLDHQGVVPAEIERPLSPRDQELERHPQSICNCQRAVGRWNPPELLPGVPGARLGACLLEEPGSFLLQLDQADVNALVEGFHWFEV